MPTRSLTFLFLDHADIEPVLAVTFGYSKADPEALKQSVFLWFAREKEHGKDALSEEEAQNLICLPI